LYKIFWFLYVQHYEFSWHWLKSAQTNFLTYNIHWLVTMGWIRRRCMDCLTHSESRYNIFILRGTILASLAPPSLCQTCKLLWTNYSDIVCYRWSSRTAHYALLCTPPQVISTNLEMLHVLVSAFYDKSEYQI